VVAAGTPEDVAQVAGSVTGKYFAGFGVTKRRADLLLITAAAVWGVSFVIVKDALAAASPLLFLADPLQRLRHSCSRRSPICASGFPAAELRAGALLTLLAGIGLATQAFGSSTRRLPVRRSS